VPFDPPGDGLLDDEGDATPESRFGDPERDLAPSTDEFDADPDLRATFWRSVLLANVALFGACFGPMIIYFRGRWLVGVASVVVAVLAVLRIRQHKRSLDGDDADGDCTDDRNA
jgi:hypothetical protein